MEEGPGAKECEQLLEAGQGKEMDPTQSFQKDCSSANVPILTQ